MTEIYDICWRLREELPEPVAKVFPEPTPAFDYPSAGGEHSAKGRSASGGKSFKKYLTIPSLEGYAKRGGAVVVVKRLLQATH